MINFFLHLDGLKVFQKGIHLIPTDLFTKWGWRITWEFFVSWKSLFQLNTFLNIWKKWSYFKDVSTSYFCQGHCIHTHKYFLLSFHVLAFSMYSQISSIIITQIWFNIMKFLFPFSCSGAVNVPSGNPKTCGSKFLRIQLFEKTYIACPCILGIRIQILKGHTFF